METLKQDLRAYNDLYCVTYIVDPNCFYIARKNEIKCGLIASVEDKIAKHMESNRKVYRGDDRPNIGDCIAYYQVEKFIRCCLIDVKELCNSMCYILFATDYGFPFHTFSTMNMYKLPEIFKFLPSPIKKVGLNIVPAVNSFDYSTFQHVTKPHHEWTKDTLARFDHYMDKSIIVGFEPITAIKHKDITFGKMIILKSETGTTVDLATRLCNKDVAIQYDDVTEFLKHFLKTSSANTDIAKEALKMQKTGIDKLPNFERHFRNTAKRMKLIFNALEQSEYKQFEKEAALKVMTWLEQNEEHEKTVPSDDEFNEDAELMDLYFKYDEDKNKIEESEVEMKEEPDEIKEVPPEVVEAVVNEPPKPLNRRFKPNLNFVPGGYQIATYVQNVPRCVNDALDDSQGRGRYKQKDEDEFESAASYAANADDDEDREWEM